MVEIINLDRTPIGIYEKALPPEMTWLERLSAAKQAGYDYVELSVDETDERLSRLDWNPAQLKDLREAIAETGMPILSMALSAHRRFPLGSESEKVREAALTIMQKAIKFALATGIRIIQLAGYDEYYQESNETTRKHFTANLKRSVEWASRVGVTLAIEVMDHEFINSVHKAMHFIDEINSPWLHVYPDIGNLSGWGLDVGAELDRGVGHTVALHVKETQPGIFKRVPFGAGNVQFTVCFEKLAELKYPGPIMVEMWTGETADAVTQISEARAWVAKKMAEGGFLC